MVESIDLYVRPVRATNGAFGHVFFVYTKSDGTQMAISLSPLDGMSGMEGGQAAINLGAWGPSHEDWRKPGEGPAQFLQTMEGDNLSFKWNAITQSYLDTAANHNYYFMTQNSNAAGSAAATAIGMSVPWTSSNIALPGVNYYQNKSEIYDGDVHTISYNDGYGDTGFLQINANGTATTESFTDGTHGLNERVGYGIGGQPLYSVEVGNNGAISSFLWHGQPFGTGDIAATFGSSLGKLLGGNSLVGQVAAGTLIGEIGRQIGAALQYSTTFTIDGAVNNAFGVLAGAPGIGTLPSAGIGALSSLLVGELANSLHLSGFEHGLFQTVGTTITTQLVTNAYGIVTGAVHTDPLNTPWALTDGFDPASLATSISGAVGAYFGSYLAGQVVHAHYETGSIGGSIGSSIGAALGTFILGPIGSFIGSFVGDLAGTFLGDMLGDDPHSVGQLWLDPVTLRFAPQPNTFHGDHGGDPTAFQEIAQYQANVLNSLLDFTGAHVDWMSSTVVPGWGEGGNTRGLLLKFVQNDHFFDAATVTTTLAHVFVNNANDLTPLIDPGIMAMIHAVHLTGGDPLVRLAWDHSTATNAAAFQTDLQMAHDYRAYLDDKPVIDALMALEPGTSFTAGWALTLLKARELGLDAVPANDDFRNGNDTLFAAAGGSHLIGGAGNDTIHGDHGNDRIEGGSGNDTIIAGDGNDLIDGGTGIDTAAFWGPRWLYLVTHDTHGVHVSGPNGNDTLTNVEFLHFDDGTTAVNDPPPRSDFNGDGKTDILWRHDNGPVSVWVMSGAQKVAEQVYAGAPADWHPVGMADFTGDGKQDILWHQDSGTLAVWTMNAVQATAMTVVSSMDPSWQVTAIADFNGDGKADVLWRHSYGAAYVMTMDGAHVTGEAMLSGLTGDWHVASTGDFTGDGKADILWHNDNGADRLWTMDGVTKVADQPVLGMAPSWKIAQTGDFDGDGKTDILWRHDYGAIDVWTMNGAQRTAENFLPGATPDYHPIATADFNGDGKADILWRHDTGAIALWTMNGMQKAADQVVSQMGNDWHLV